MKTGWKDIAELIGIATIIASLIFVGLQMQQSQRIALSAIYQARSDSSMAIRMAGLESEALLSGQLKLRTGQQDDITPLERTALNQWWSGELIYLENVHYQYINGFLTEEHWQTNVAELEGLLRQSGWGQDFEKDCRVFRESFCDEMMRAARKVASESAQ